MDYQKQIAEIRILEADMKDLGWIKYEESLKYIKFSNFIKKITVSKIKPLTKEITENIKVEARKRKNWTKG